MASPVLNNKVGFLVGPQSSIGTINTNKTATPGHFYLTSDAHRLYIGNSDGSLSPVNEGVSIVSTIQELESITISNPALANGQFYYVTGANVLCVYSGGRWVQINPDTHLLSSNTAISGSVITTNSVKLETTVEDTNSSDNTVSNRARGNFTIAGGDNVTVTWDNNTNTVTLSTPDAGVYDLITGINSTTNKPELILAEYADHTKSGNPINTTAIQIIGDSSGYVTTGRDASGNITITGTGLSGATISATANGNGVFYTLNDGHGGTVSTPVITPSVTLKNADGTTTQPIYFTNTITSTPNSVSQAIGLNVYTKDAVDALLAESMQDAEGMYFYGTLGNGGTKASFATLAAATDVRSGATLKIIENNITTTGYTIEGFDAANDTIEAGDMIIVVGDEYQNTNSSNTTTYLDPSDPNYDPTLIGTLATRRYIYIPSGNDTDVYWTPDVTTAKEITWSHSNGTNTEKIVFAEATNSQITVSGNNVHSSATDTQTLTIGHKNMYSGNTNTSAPTVTTATAATTSGTATTNYTAITGLTLENGHITGYETKQISLVSNRLSKVISTATAVGNDNDTVKLTNTYHDDIDIIGLAAKNDWQLSSDSLQVTVGAAGGNSATAATSFTGAADIHIDMVWGTFS